MQIVPLNQTAAQSLNISLNNQSCGLSVYQKQTGLYLDLTINDLIIVQGAICLDRNLIVRSQYLGLSGDLAFVDTQGTSDPFYTGFTTRWILVYLFPEELARRAPLAWLWAPLTPGVLPPPDQPPPVVTPPSTTAPSVPTGVTIT